MKSVLLLLVPSALLAQRPLNLDFERAGVSGPDRPWGWGATPGWSPLSTGIPATFVLDSAVAHHGKRSLRVSLPSAAFPAPQTIQLQVPAAPFSGREVTLEGWLRSAGVRRRAFLSLETWGDRVVRAGDTAFTASDSGWTRHTLRIRVDSIAHSLVIIAGLDGAGTAWFDHLSLAVDGKPLESLPTGVDPTASELHALSTHATALTTVRAPRAGDAPRDDDLASFDRIVGEARVVGLGESTHGTSEFFLVKHRLLEHLVRTRGFSVFAIEANQLAVESLNRYVQGGPGTSPDAMRVMFAVWNTEEMLELVEWMRTWNAAHPGRTVRFLGYDMQDNRLPVDSLRAFLARQEPALVPMVDEYLGEYRAMASWSVRQVADSTRTRWRENAEEVLREVTGHRAGWLGQARNRADTLGIEWAVQAANLVLQAARGNETLNVPDRDSLMAANLHWALETLTPGARAVAWAHDIHVSRGGDKALSFFNGATMGAELKRRLGRDYVAFSLLTYDGAYTGTRSFADHEMISAEAFPGPAGSMERALHLIARPAGTVGHVLDLGSPARRLVGSSDWLRAPRRLRHIGYAAFDYAFEMEAVFPLEFDGIIFIDRTNPSRPLKKDGKTEGRNDGR